MLALLVASFRSRATTLRSTLLNPHHRTTACSLPVVGKLKLGDASVPPASTFLPPLPGALIKKVKSGNARLNKDCVPFFCPNWTSSRCCGDTKTTLDNVISQKIDLDSGRSFIKTFRVPWRKSKCTKTKTNNSEKQERQPYPRPTLCANDGVIDYGKRAHLRVCASANKKACNRAYCNFDAQLCERILQRHPAVRTSYHIFPIVFGIPSHAIVPCVGRKTKDFASVIPGYADATYSVRYANSDEKSKMDSSIVQDTARLLQ